jgi:signal transduction histidine kinase
MKLKGIANAVSLQIKGEDHEKLFAMYADKNGISGLGQDSCYDNIHTLLKNHIEANMLKSPLYTLVKSKDQNNYEFGITSDTTPYFRHPYKSFPAPLIDMYLTGGILEPYQDEYGSWLSAFSTIKNKKGEIVALLMVDEKIENFKQKLWAGISNSVIIIFIFIFLILSILSYYLLDFLTREWKDRKLLQNTFDENQRMSLSLQVANDKLSDIDSFRKEMIANLSHDLRTPLASTLGYLELVKDDAKLDEKSSRYLNIAYHEGQKLKEMISSLFELSKLESGSVVLHKELFNIHELITDVLLKYNFEIEKKRVNLYQNFENTGQAFGDIKYIERLFQNLLDNAVKNVDEEGLIKISIINLESSIRVKVCNSGKPIPAELQKDIFERYVKGNGSGGTGLGLAISKKICDLHNCSITLEVNDNINSFWFNLPKAT